MMRTRVSPGMLPARSAESAEGKSAGSTSWPRRVREGGSGTASLEGPGGAVKAMSAWTLLTARIWTDVISARRTGRAKSRNARRRGGILSRIAALRRYAIGAQVGYLPHG